MIRIEVSNRFDGPGESDLANGNAYTVLEALNLDAESVGDLPLEGLRDRLAAPEIRKAFCERQVDHRLVFFDRAASLNPHEQTPQLVWA